MVTMRVILPILLGLCLTVTNAAEFQLADQQQQQQQDLQQQQQLQQQELHQQQQEQQQDQQHYEQYKKEQEQLQQEMQQQQKQYEQYTQEQQQLEHELQQQRQQHDQQLQSLLQLRQQQEQDPQQALVSENDLPQKVIAKKSVQDEEAIQAAQAYEFEYLPESSNDYGNPSHVVEIEQLASASHDDHHDHHPKVGYSAGGPLVNIAQGAAAAAHNFEKNQPAAAAQAAYVAKNRLGQSAGLAAGTAAAAFAGKQIIYRGLQQQAYNAHRALESEKLQLQSAQRAATAAANAAQQAMHQVQVITTALNAAQATAQHASAAAAAAAGELAAQTAMVGAAKARLQAIEEQLHHARIDFEAAQHANRKAAHAAQVAQNNAAAAAQHAAEVANARHHHHDDDHHHHHEKLTDDSDDHDHHESIVIPISSSSSQASATPSSGSAETDRTGRVLHSAAPDHSGLVAGTNGNKDELYDSYDSYPY